MALMVKTLFIHYKLTFKDIGLSPDINMTKKIVWNSPLYERLYWKNQYLPKLDHPVKRTI